MLVWRLSVARYADAFDGGYGLLYDGRWNSAGHAVTYGATSPSLCVLEKLVHVDDPALLPPLIMVSYEVPDDLHVETVSLDDLPDDWRARENETQRAGDSWHRARKSVVLCVPPAVVPIAGSPDVNVVFNHTHPEVAAISMKRRESFALDMRLF